MANDKKETAKAAAAGAQSGTAMPTPPTLGGNDKKSMWTKALEIFQWVIIALGYRQGVAQDQEKRKQLPVWVLSIVSPWSHEDEERYVSAIDSATTDRSRQRKFFDFVSKAVNDGYDFYIIKMSLLRWYTVYQAEKDKTHVVNSASITVNQIIDADRNYKEQKRIAKDREILVRMGLVKAYFKFLRENKLFAPFILLFTILIMLVLFIMLIVGIIWFTIWCAKNTNAIANWLSYFWQLITWTVTWIDNILDKLV